MRAVISSDWHIRPDKPRCRIDEDWELTQRNMVKNIVSICNEYNAPLCIVGDLFNKGTVPEALMIMLIEEFSKMENTVHILAGNHDLPYHSMQNIANSSIGVFFALAQGHNKIVYGMTDFGDWHDFNGPIVQGKDTFLFTHELVYRSTKSIPPNCTGMTAKDLLIKYPDYYFIFTGDNHKCFTVETDTGFVINPGCTIRQSVDEMDYEPSVFLVDTYTSEIKKIPLGDNAAMVNDAYIQKQEERDNRIGAFLEALKKNNSLSLSIIDNIENAIKKNRKKLDEDTILMIRKLVED